MNKNYIVEQKTGCVTWIKFTEKNKKGESLVVELSKCENHNSKNSLPNLWHKNGYIDRVLETYWCIQTFMTDSEGNCFGLYNPQVKLSEDGKRNVLNFDWMFETTEQNKEKLINEVYRLFSTATDKTATEIKQEKIKEYAKEYNLKIFNTIPEGWKKLNMAYSPVGSVLITNRLTLKSGNRDKGILILA